MDASPRRILIIGNPISGAGRGKARIEAMRGELERAGHSVRAILTGAAGDVKIAAREVDPSAVDTLVAVGGDGTVHEIINGLADPGRIPIALLPTGTANLLARDLALPNSPRAVVGLIERGNVRRLDLCRVTASRGSRRFLLVASAGFDASVIDLIHRDRGRSLGVRGYFAPIRQVVSEYEPQPMSVTVDDGPAVTGEWVIAAKTKTYAAFFRMADDAAFDSGMLAVRVFAKGGGWALWRYAWAGWSRRESKLKDVVRMRGRRVRIESRAAPVPVEVDGEFIGHTPVQMDLTPGVVPVVVP